jgi:DNA-binding transcriptional LysR family regulator
MTFDGRMISNVGVLAAIVQGGSFARAAEALGLSPSGVSRAITRLEGRIGVRLLDRNTRSVSLTDEGRKLYANIGPLLTEIDDALRITSGSAEVVRGRLRVNVDAFFSRFMFAAHIGRFLELHPEVSLELVARDQLGDLLGDGFDLAIRFGSPPDSAMIVRKLLETKTVTVASPAYLARHGEPKQPGDLAGHVCIQMHNSQTGQTMEDWAFVADGKTLNVQTRGRLVVNDAGTLLGACVTGCRHCADQVDWRPGPARNGRTCGSVGRLGDRILSPVRNLSVAAPAGCQGSRLHRFCAGDRDRAARLKLKAGSQTTPAPFRPWRRDDRPWKIRRSFCAA